MGDVFDPLGLITAPHRPFVKMFKRKITFYNDTNVEAMFIISPKKVTSRREQKATLGGTVGVSMIGGVSGGVEHTFITEEGEESPAECVVQPGQFTSHEPDSKSTRLFVTVVTKDTTLNQWNNIHFRNKTVDAKKSDKFHFLEKHQQGVVEYIVK